MSKRHTHQGQPRFIVEHFALKDWADQHGAVPATVDDGTESIGELDFHFPGLNDDGLRDVDWDEFLAKFDHDNLALLVDEARAPEDEPNLAFEFTSRSNPKEGLREFGQRTG